MKTLFAINGLGRIGRALFRIAATRDDMEVIALNDLAPASTLARLLRRDSVHGPWDRHVKAEGESLIFEERKIPVYHEAEPGRIPWDRDSVPLVVDCTGRFAGRQAADHLLQGVDHVIISANAADADFTVCLGVNDALLDPSKHRLISNASCTTNCIAPVAKVIDDHFGLEYGLITTIHAYTPGQNLLDGPHENARYGRAAAINLIPAATGAATAVGLVIPQLSGRLDGQAIRVPTANVSTVHLIATLRTKTTKEELAEVFRVAAQSSLEGILSVVEEELVSSDFLGNSHSSVVDLTLTQQLQSHLYRMVAWYDNEWGYANRLADLVALLSVKLAQGDQNG